VGPQALASGTWYSSAVPILGAKHVTFKLRGSDANALVNTTGSVIGNDVTGTKALNSSSLVSLYGGGANTIDAPDGLSISFRPTGPDRFMHSFFQLGFTSNAAGHTAVVCDAEVYYDSDADVALADYGQTGLTVPA